MPDPAKETDFVACKIDGKVWKNQALKWFGSSLEKDFTSVDWCKECYSISAQKRVENECDTISDYFHIKWNGNKENIRKIRFLFTQYEDTYKAERGYVLDTLQTYSLEFYKLEPNNGIAHGSFSGTLIGGKDTLKITEGIFKIGQ